MKSKISLSIFVSFAVVVQPLVASAGRGAGGFMPIPTAGSNTVGTNSVGTNSETGSTVTPAPAATTAAPPAVTATPSTASQTAPTRTDPTIQEVAVAAQNNSGSGIKLAAAGAIAAAAFAAYNCAHHNYWECGIGAAGALACYISMNKMVNAQNEANQTYQAVTTDAPPTQDQTKSFVDVPTSNSPTADAPKPPSQQMNGPLKVVTTKLDDLKKQGVKIDPKKKTITTPDGKVIPTSAVSSAAAMKALGAPDSAIKAFNDSQNAALKKAEKEIKSADGSDSFGGDLGGGGGKSSASASPEVNPYAGAPGIPGQHLGVNRDPAQVAGMKKNYNGEPIGVAGDSLFNMIDRRYELHDKNGSFLPP